MLPPRELFDYIAPVLARTTFAIAIATVAGCSNSCGSCGEDDRVVPREPAMPEAGVPSPPRLAVPTPSEPVPAPAPTTSFGGGVRPVYPTPVPLVLADDLEPLDPPLRAVRVDRIENRPLAVVSGVSAAGPTLELIDVDRGLVRWRDTSCAAPAVHTTGDRIICAGWKGIAGLAVDDGVELWRSERVFRAAHQRYLLARDTDDAQLAAVIDAQTGDTVVELLAPPGESFDDAQRLCPTDSGFDVISWSAAGTMRRLRYARVRNAPSNGRLVWTRRLPRQPAKTDLCQPIMLFEVPIPGSELRRLHAASARSGKDVARPIEVYGWWREDDGIATSTAAGVQRRSRQLEVSASVTDAVLGRLVARWDSLRLVRSVANTLALVDEQGLRAWLGAPSRVDRAVLTGGRLLAGSWLSPPQSKADTVLLYELPTARSATAPPALASGPSSIPEPKPQKVPPRPVWKPATYRMPDVGTHGVTRFAVRDGEVFAVAMSRRPSVKSGAGVAAFDLATRKWRWHTQDACAVNAAAVGLGVADDVVVCAAAEHHPGRGHLTAVDRATGAVRWRTELPTVDRIAAAGSAVVAHHGARVSVVDAASGEILYELSSDNGHLARIAPVRLKSGETRVIAVESGGVLVGRRAVAGGEVVWSVGIDGYIWRVVPRAGGVAVQLATGELYLVDAATGAATALPDRSAEWQLPPGSDLVIDQPIGTEGVTVLRGFDMDGREAFRSAFAITPPLGLAQHRTPGAPLVFVSHRGEGRIIVIGAGGQVRGSYHFPEGMVPNAVFSAVVGGQPVVGAVLQKPLAVALF